MPKATPFYGVTFNALLLNTMNLGGRETDQVFRSRSIFTLFNVLIITINNK